MSVPYEEQLRKVLASTPTYEFISAMTCYNNPGDMIQYVQRRYQLLESMSHGNGPMPTEVLQESTTRSGKVFRRPTKKTS